MSGVTTLAAAEFGLVVAPFDVETPAAALERIVRVDKYHCHSPGFCPVADKLLQRVKRPSRKHSPLLFTIRYRLPIPFRFSRTMPLRVPLTTAMICLLMTRWVSLRNRFSFPDHFLSLLLADRVPSR